MAFKAILCAIRTVGAVALVGVMWWGARSVGWSYEDTRTVLGLVTNFLPETILLFGIGGGAFVFYRMDADEKNDFTFAAFFKAGSQYDIYRFGYFWLLIIASWTIFITAWRDKELVALVSLILTIFVAKSAVDSVAGAIGKPRGDST